MASEPTVYQYEAYAQDPEVRAIEVLTAVLEPMEPHARHRVLMYLADRWAGGDWPESPMG